MGKVRHAFKDRQALRPDRQDPTLYHLAGVWKTLLFISQEYLGLPLGIGKVNLELPHFLPLSGVLSVHSPHPLLVPGAPPPQPADPGRRRWPQCCASAGGSREQSVASVGGWSRARGAHSQIEWEGDNLFFQSGRAGFHGCVFIPEQAQLLTALTPPTPHTHPQLGDLGCC